MALSKSGFERKSGVSDEIPSSSLADIAFLLLIFFMVTTVFRTTRDRPIVWPQAEATERIDEKRQNIMHVWLERNGDVWINDMRTPIQDVRSIVRPAYLESERRLVISLRADTEVPYRFTNQLMEEFKAAGAVRLVFATELERRMARERR
ncbi:MAG: biopolymer transporter ExbD [Gemmatimonadota bacterium]|jgi:biopolymer transport protein ExbD